ncbi:MAG: coiled coil domain-containing protein [Verrucomicrobia bacterium]|nr:coiled coil domain-containing protein [Verrucomicrobiota bacterium]MCH8511410.1 coiled coil domain-containing protein [Kiritimatiellia bacterium]
MSHKELHEQKIQAQIEEWKADIAKLKAKASKADADAKLALEKEQATLEDKIANAKVRLKEIRESSGDAWDEMKSGAKDAWGSLSDAAGKAAEKFKS